MVSYVAKELAEIDNGPERASYLRVGVFRVDDGQEEQIGEYLRNYSDLSSTFFPFVVNGKDYALYSPEYTATHVMELRMCKDIGGEKPLDDDFCPLEYFIPSYVIHEVMGHDGLPRHERINNPEPEDLVPRTDPWFRRFKRSGERYRVEAPSTIVTPHTYYPFGFVAGIVWGASGGLEIQYLDLSEVEKGVISRESRFGYIELPDNLTLPDAIDMEQYLSDDRHTTISIAVQRRFDLTRGSMSGPEA